MDNYPAYNKKKQSQRAINTYNYERFKRLFSPGLINIIAFSISGKDTEVSKTLNNMDVIVSSLQWSYQ